MTFNKTAKTPTLMLQHIEAQLDKLIRSHQALEKENKALRAQYAAWQSERTQLMERNDIARVRVESMIARLKTLETES